MIYNINFNIAALFINVVLVLLAYLRKTPPKIANTVFRVMLLSNLAAIIFDILSTFTISFPERYSMGYVYLINILYYLFHNFSAFLYVMYGLVTDSERVGNKKIRGTVITVFCIVVLSIITTPYTRFVFYFDSALVYQHGPLLYALYAIALLSVIFVMYLKLSNRETQSPFQIVTNISYTVALLGAFVYHTINDSVLIELFVIALGYTVMYISLNNPEQYLYKTLLVYNKPAFDDYASYEISMSKGFNVLIFTPKGKDAYMKHYPTSIRFSIEKYIISVVKDKARENKVFVLSEFCYAVVCTDLKTERERIDGLFEHEILIDDKEYKLDMTYAVIRYPEIAQTASDFFILLDDLLFRLGNQITSEALEANPSALLTEEKKRCENLLVNAIQEGKFFVRYEPIFDTRSSDALNAEARLMIRNGADAIEMNEEMYRIAEDDGLIVDIDEIAFKLVGDFIQRSNIQGLGINNIVVNLSMEELSNIHLISRIEQIIGKYNLPCDHMTFKLLDLNLSVNGDIIRANINKLHDFGFKFVIDNYGENSVNLASFIDLPVIGVKLGDEMTNEAALDEKHKIIFVGLIRILKELGYAVACSDVSSLTEEELAKSTGIDYVQGPIYSKALDEDAFVSFYRTQLMNILHLLNHN